MDGSEDDLNVVRHRAGLSDTAFSNQQEALTAIYHERRLELFGEFGFRWLDLKRTHALDLVMPSISAAKGGSWETTDQLYPIPLGRSSKPLSLYKTPDIIELN